MPTTGLLDEASALVKRRATRAKIKNVFLLLYVASSLGLMDKFYRQLSDTCEQRSHSRAALVTILVSLNGQSDHPNGGTAAYVLKNLPPLHC